MLKKVICITGKAESGKDTLAEFMQKYYEYYGHKTVVIRNADLLKYILKTFYDWDGNKDIAGRDYLQIIGTDVIRAQNPDFWVNFVASIIQLLKEERGWDYVIVPDCRFENEVTVLREQGFNVEHIYITRDGFNSHLNEEQLSHSSEVTDWAAEMANYYISNNGNLDDLKESATKLCDAIAFSLSLKNDNVVIVNRNFEDKLP